VQQSGKMVTLVLLLILQLVGWVSGRGLGATWNYENPTEWVSENPKCDGKAQSPMKINTNLARNAHWVVRSSGYDKKPDRWIVTNTGYTLRLSLDANSAVTPTMKIEELDKTFVFAEANFHWSSGQEGAEHEIDGTHAAMELQLVHVNQKYPTMPEDLANTDGLMIIAVTFQLGVADNKYAPLTNALKLVRNADTSTTINSTIFSIYDLLPPLKNVYSYQGSLTRPGCEEAVIWVVTRDVITISRDQLGEFQRLCKDHEGKHPIGSNVRPLQKRNGRTVSAIHLEEHKVAESLTAPGFYRSFNWSAVFKNSLSWRRWTPPAGKRR